MLVTGSNGRISHGFVLFLSIFFVIFRISVMRWCPRNSSGNSLRPHTLVGAGFPFFDFPAVMRLPSGLTTPNFHPHFFFSVFLGHGFLSFGGSLLLLV